MSTYLILNESKNDILVSDYIINNFRDVSFSKIDAKLYVQGTIRDISSVSLFANTNNSLIINSYENANNELLTDLKTLVDDNFEYVIIILNDKRIIKKLSQPISHIKYKTISIPAIKKEKDVLDFIKKTVMPKNITPDASALIYEAYLDDGKQNGTPDIYKIYGVCKQLLFDCHGDKIDKKDILNVLGGNKKIQIFDITNTLSEGNINKTLEKILICLDNKIDLLFIVTIIANKIRQIADYKYCRENQIKPKLPPFMTRSISLSFWDWKKIFYITTGLSHIEFCAKTSKASNSDIVLLFSRMLSN